MTSNIEREISREIPHNIPVHFSNGRIPLFTAYGCTVFERDTGKGYVYSAANLTTGKREIINRRTTPLTTSGVGSMLEKLRMSSVAGAGRLEADRPFGETIPLTNCHEMQSVLFNEILPQYGYTVRAEQIALAENILDAINRRLVLLAEVGVGTGKTIAYLIAAAIAKRGRLNGYWNMSYYTGSPYIELAHMPVIIATSSIALQKALATDSIPALSDILLEHDIIKTPLTCVIRKGREHYVCERNLRAHIQFEHDESMKHILTALLMPNAEIDLAEIDGLTPHVKRIISVPKRCRSDCPHLGECSYFQFRRQIQSPEYDFQICNHNYLIADTAHREKDQRQLLSNYQLLIIDEAHKFYETARSMHSLELSSLTAPEIWERVAALKLNHVPTKKEANETARKMAHESRRLFSELAENASTVEDDDECGRHAVKIGKDTARHLRNISDIADRLLELLRSERDADREDERKNHIFWDLLHIREQTATLSHYNTYIYCLETGNSDNSKAPTPQGLRLCAVPKNTDRRLYDTLWSKGVPTILTSGTLSASGAGTPQADFSRIKSKLGLERVGNRLREVSMPPTFDYYNNSIIYISECVPFPDPRSAAYLAAITDEIEKLVTVSHGHAAVLFTSYNVMGRVYAALNKRLPFPMFRMDKGGVREIERFKQSGNGVLFASGAFWEGIDVKGHALSLLVVVKLPFSYPGFWSEYERSQYEGKSDYMKHVIKPDCLIKSKQAYGRVFRSEDDTGAVAFLDSRLAENDVHRDYFLSGLPYCRVTSDLRVLESFYRTVKPDEYFE